MINSTYIHEISNRNKEKGTDISSKLTQSLGLLFPQHLKAPWTRSTLCIMSGCSAKKTPFIQ